MTQFLPPNLLALFAPRDSAPFLPPVDKLTHEKKRQPYTGVADYLQHFEDPEETPPPTKIETKEEKLDRKRKEKAEQNAYKLEQDLALWDPTKNQNITFDPYKTLFVARINYDTSESKLRREFETYGKIKQIKLVHDKITNKPRGYAFIEYEQENDMHAAYKRADGKKIDGKRVLVDIERGRTIKGWKPRRLGGGKGGRKSHYDPMLLFSTTNDLTNRLDSFENNDSDKRNRDRDNKDREKDRDRERDRDRDRDRDRERDKDRERDRERKRSKDKAKSKSRSRSRERERKKRSKSRDRRSRSKDKIKKARRSKSKERQSSKNEQRKEKRSRSRSKDRERKMKSGSGGYGENTNGNGIRNEPVEAGELVY